MSIHIKLAATATGDAITAISTTVKVAKDADVEIDLLIQNINIRVRPTSDVQDIIEIYRLKSNKIVMSETKIILDACCGSRMFWFDKENPLTLFADIRDEEHTLCDGRSLKIHPDIVSDFTDMPFLEESFKLVVFDPPHLLKVGKDSWLAKKYGKLPEDWPRVIKKGIDECFRVLEDYGVLIFKWNEDQITVRKVLEAIGRKPLFGHTTGRHGKTMWMCFMKLPNNV